MTTHSHVGRKSFPWFGATGWPALIALTLVSAGAGGLFPTVLLSRRALEIDLELGRREVVLWWALMCGAVAFGALVSGFAASLGGARRMLAAGAALSGTAFVALALVNDAMVLRALLVGAAFFVAPSMTLTRSVALEAYGPTGGWRVVALPWAGFALGASGFAFTQLIRFFPNWGYVLGVYGALSFVGALFCLNVPESTPAQQRDQPRTGSYRPWTADRGPSVLLAFSVGLATLGSAPVAIRLLTTKWGMDPRAVGGVLLLACLVAGGFAATGHWYHRLATRDPLYQLGVSGSFALATCGLIAIGAASITYFGAVASWVVAGASLLGAAVATETGLLAWRAPGDRSATAAVLVAAFSTGAAIAMTATAFSSGISRGWLVVACATPGFVVSAIVAYAGRPTALASPPTPTPTPTPTPAPVFPPATGSPVADGAQRPALLEVCDLNVSYDNVQVLFGVDLAVQEGQIVALMGTNGAGKTTLLRTISGLERQQRGSIHFAGVDISEFDPTWRVSLGITQIAGGRGVAEALTVAEHLRLFTHTLEGSHSEQVAAVDRALAVFPRLAERQSQLTSTLSGGEKQMLALAKALILRPRLLVIDEFSLGLAPRIVGELLPVVSQINAAGTAVLMVEQSVNIALSIASHAYVMEKGQIVYEGDAETLRADPDLMRAVYLEGITKALAHDGALTAGGPT